MNPQTCILIGAPVDSGKRRAGCLMGPDALRTAGLTSALTGLGHEVEDFGNLSPAPYDVDTTDGPLFAPNETIGWTQKLAETAEQAMPVLSTKGLATTPSGGAGLAALLSGFPDIDQTSRVLCILSEESDT